LENRPQDRRGWFCNEGCM